MTISDWIKIASTVIIVVNSWLIAIILLPATHPIKIRLNAFNKGFLKTRWRYLSIIFVIILISSLVVELLKSTPLTRLSVFFISLLVTSIIVQSLLIYVLTIKQKLEQQIDDTKNEARRIAFFLSS